MVPHLRSGDLLFRRGTSWRSGAVLLADTGAYSHVGLVVDTPDGLRVVHAAPPEDGWVATVLSEPIARFVDPSAARAVAARRPHSLSDSALEAARQAALAYAEQRVPFDSDFSLEDDRAVYCTELIWRAFLAAGVDLTEGARDTLRHRLASGVFLLPSTLFQSAHLVDVRAPTPH